MATRSTVIAPQWLDITIRFSSDIGIKTLETRTFPTTGDLFEADEGIEDLLTQARAILMLESNLRRLRDARIKAASKSNRRSSQKRSR